jgi:hypothetical protein
MRRRSPESFEPPKRRHHSKPEPPAIRPKPAQPPREHPSQTQATKQAQPKPAPQATPPRQPDRSSAVQPTSPSSSQAPSPHVSKPKPPPPKQPPVQEPAPKPEPPKATPKPPPVVERSRPTPRNPILEKYGKKQNDNAVGEPTQQQPNAQQIVSKYGKTSQPTQSPDIQHIKRDSMKSSGASIVQKYGRKRQQSNKPTKELGNDILPNIRRNKGSER